MTWSGERGEQGAAVRWDEVIAHPRVVGALRAALARQRMTHALLLYGPEGVGKTTLAGVVAAAWLCDAPERGGACGQCPSCQAARRGAHPDRLAVAPASRAGHLTLAQVQELRRWLELTPVRRRRKAAVVDQAEQLTPEAANGLLKVLEEPPEGTLVVLVARDRGLVLPTVQSRCMVQYVAPLPVAELARELAARGMPQPQALERARAARGRPAAALGAQGPDRAVQAAAEWLRRALADPPPELDRLAQRLEGADLAEVDATLCAMMWLWTERAGAAAAAGRMSRAGAGAVAQGLQHMLVARRMVNEYASRRLVMDWLWMSLRRLAATGRLPLA
ncbi:MAG TPA: hypothetical protein VIL11_02165 [Limnochordales bacterium]